MKYMSHEESIAHARRIDAAQKKEREEEYRHHREAVQRQLAHMELLDRNVERQTAALETIAAHFAPAAPVVPDPATCPECGAFSMPHESEQCKDWAAPAPTEFERYCGRCDLILESQDGIPLGPDCPSCGGPGWPEKPVPAPTTVPPWEAQLDELANLPPNWDSYNARSIDPRAVESVRRWLRSPSLAPTGNGGLLITVGDANVWVKPDGTIEQDDEPPAPTAERVEAIWKGLRGGDVDPNRCKCANNPDNYPGTPHRHYEEPPHACARCKCAAYDPSVPTVPATEGGKVQCPAYTESWGQQWRCQHAAGHGGLHEWSDRDAQQPPVSEGGTMRERAREFFDQTCLPDVAPADVDELARQFERVAREARAAALPDGAREALDTWRALGQEARTEAVRDIATHAETLKESASYTSQFAKRWGPLAEGCDAAARLLRALAGTK